jgi:hypothetical protein
MSVRSTPRRRLRRLAVTAISLTAIVGLAAGPASAHGDEDHSKSSKSDCQEMKGMDMCGKGVYLGKGKYKKTKANKKSSAKAKVGTMVVIDGALTGDSPCEKSGPPASVGQVKQDAEGHDHRGPNLQYPLTRAEREQLIVEQTEARKVAERYPTVASAEAAGYKKSTAYVPCIGAHYTNIALVGKFDVAAPSELLYDGTNPDSRIVGLSYLVMNRGGAPEGFAGPNDIWHQHNSNGGLCLNAQGVVVGNESTSPKDCAARGGRKVKLDDIWMVHDWVVPGWECGWGVFAGECPELGGRVGGTVFDEPDPEAFARALGSSASEKVKSKKQQKDESS